MTFFTRRKIQKSWDCDAHELRLVLRLAPGYRFSGMQIGCGRVSVEYFRLDQPDHGCLDTFDLQVPVKGEEATHALRQENGQEVLNLWIPRHCCTTPGRDPYANLTNSAGPSSWVQAAS